ncbi:hypothetical protein L3Q82_007214 [Scortum barcoo]|uniref:Uncharacterized protein n=1 Tax=Scortum barcoo TaxID=214431 RepID=A0ACB8WSF0_9TELE|nr:hypothetical protein L3Q82_007214 [Scortum barcoo]
MIPFFISNNNYTVKGEMLLEFLNQSTLFCSQFENGEWYCYILMIFFAFALPVGILGNIAAIINYVCFRKTSSASTVFLLNLALCDSAWILTLPFTLYLAFRGPYLKDIDIFCQFKKISFNINIYGSILFLTLISFDRYVGTVHPISSLRWWDVGKAKLCSVFTWVALVLSSIPDLFVTFAVQRPKNATVCMDHVQGPFIYVKTITIIRTTVGFLLPFGGMLAFYIMTVRVLRRLPRGRRHRGAQWVGGKPLRLITAAILVFVVSFVPYHVMIITLVFMRINNQVTPFNTNILFASYELFEVMCSVSSCLDPVLYILASDQFQRKLLAFRRERYRRLCCRAGRRVGFENGEWYCYILMIFFAFALPVGILGNIAAIINYVCFRKTSSASTVFLLNLALCDSAWILTLPFTLYLAFRGPYLKDIDIFCQFKKISFNINIYGSILFLTLISFDRYVGTVHPISSLRWWDVGKAKLCSVFTWVALVLSSIPDLFVTFAVQRPKNATVCMDHVQGPFIYVKTITIIRTTVGFLLPFGGMLAFYIMTVRVLRRLPRGRRHRGAQWVGGKPLRLITAAILVFVVSFVPYHVMIITLVFMRINNQVTPFNTNILFASYELFEVMCSVSSCLDPVLYILASDQFQRKLLAFRRERYRRLCCRAGRRVGPCDNGQYPAHYFEDVPSEARVLVEQEGEAVAHHDHMGLRLAVRDGVLREDEEVEEGDEGTYSQFEARAAFWQEDPQYAWRGTQRTPMERGGEHADSTQTAWETQMQ